MTDILCEDISHQAKPPRAKVVTLHVVAEPKKEMFRNSLSKTLAESRQSAIDSGKYLQASDGNYVGLGLAMCGTHVKVHRPGRRVVPADMVAGLGGKDAALAIQYAKDMYEQALIEEAARQQQQAEDWHQHMLEGAREPVVLGTPKVGKDSRWGEWEVELVNATSDKAVAHVSISLDGGVGRLNISDYSGSVGRGRGNLSYIRSLQQALVLAEEAMVANYRENGLDV